MISITPSPIFTICCCSPCFHLPFAMLLYLNTRISRVFFLVVCALLVPSPFVFPFFIFLLLFIFFFCGASLVPNRCDEKGERAQPNQRRSKDAKSFSYKYFFFYYIFFQGLLFSVRIMLPIAPIISLFFFIFTFVLPSSLLPSDTENWKEN